MELQQLAECFQKAALEAMRQGLVPDCEWTPWVFQRPKDKSHGDLSSQTVVQTAHHYAQLTGRPVDLESWTNALISVLPTVGDLPDLIESVFSAKGYINIRLKTPRPSSPKAEEGFLMKPIGHMETCFSEKFGTPRQSKVYSGLYATDARGKIVLSSNMNLVLFDTGLSRRAFRVFPHMGALRFPPSVAQSEHEGETASSQWREARCPRDPQSP